MVFIRNKYSQYVTMSDVLSCVSKNIEMLPLSIKNPKMRVQNISVVYRPPNGSIPTFINTLRIVTEDVNKLNTDVTIIGDYNINYNQRNSKGYRQLKTFERYRFKTTCHC